MPETAKSLVSGIRSSATALSNWSHTRMHREQGLMMLNEMQYNIDALRKLLEGKGSGEEGS